MKPVTVGSFLLAEPLASGGMGSVWRAVHRSGVAAAVKIIPAEAEDGKRVVPILDPAASLQAEIRSVGALDHPNIIRVFDAGTLELEHERASGGQLRAGSPWLAMELCDGSVYDLHRDFDWSQLCALLLQVLDALAHAHARGVVHRDLKPANLLYVRSPSTRILLADFGLAWRRGGDLVHGGSLPYAAPEQILGVRTEQGPWTDLYGLGCCAYRLATGQRPYRGSDPDAIKRGHLFGAIPKPQPRFPVPAGFAAWLAGLMAKDPGERFQTAADAAYALLQLEAAGGVGAVRAPIDEDVTAGTSSRLGSEHTATLPVLHWTLREADPARAAASRIRPPVPADWAPPAPDRPSPFGGRGLGLFGLRVPPIAGRAAERDRLWQALIDLDQPRLVVLRGGAGTGKSRLASWLVERAAEVGAAEGFRARFEPDVGHEGVGLAGLVEEHLNTHGLPADEIVRHLRHRVSDDVTAADREAYGLARLLRPDDALLRDDPLAGSERVATVWRLLRRRASRRLIVWLDDVQHDLEALDLVDHAVANPVPVLFVATCRDEPPAVRDRLRGLVEQLDGIEFDLEPLSVREIETLVKRMVPAEGDLAARIAQNAGGSPQVAVQLVAALVERGALSGDAGGVRLASTEELPASLADLWSAALDRLDVPGARAALGVAAVLGATFTHTQWREVAHRLDRPFAPSVPAVLVNRGFVVPERSGGRYSFAHPVLRDLLATEARAEGPAVDLACAAALDGLGPAFAARAAAHLEAGGDLAGAADHALAAMRWLADWDRGRALEVSERWVATLTRIAADPDPRWAPGLAVRIELLAAIGGPAYAAAIQELLRQGRATRDAPAEIRGLVEAAQADLRALALDRAEARAELAAHRSRGTGLHARATITRAEVRRRRGDLRAAESTLRELVAADPVDPGPAVLALARVLCDGGRGAEAVALLDRWSAELPPTRTPVARAWALRARGQALVAAGQLTEAVAVLTDAEAWRARAHWDWPLLALDRGSALLAHGDHSSAGAVLAPVLGRFDPATDGRWRGHALAALAEIALVAGDSDGATRLVQALEALPTRGHRPETRIVLIRVGQLARRSGEHGLAHRARRWADRTASATPPLDARRVAE